MLKTASRLSRSRTFEHDFWHFQPLTEEYRNGHRYYRTPDGNAYPSVTSILGAKSDKSSLESWKKRVGEEKAERIKTQAGVRGTAIHKLAESYLLNEEHYPEKTMPVNKMTFASISPILDKHIGVVNAIEAPLYSHRLKTAGRTDCVAQFDGINSIVDFKTSLRTKKEDWIQNYFVQATCYATMVEELTNQLIPQIVIIIAVDHEDPQVFIKKKEDYMEKMLEIFDGSVT